MIPRRTVAGLLGGEPVNGPERRSGREQGRGLRGPLDEHAPGWFGIHPSLRGGRMSAREVRTDDRTIHTRGTDRLAAPVQRLFNRSGVLNDTGRGRARQRCRSGVDGQPAALGEAASTGRAAVPRSMPMASWAEATESVDSSTRLRPDFPLRVRAGRPAPAPAGLAPGNPWPPDGRSIGRRATDRACARTAAPSVLAVENVCEGDSTSTESEPQCRFRAESRLNTEARSRRVRLDGRRRRSPGGPRRSASSSPCGRGRRRSA